MRKSLSTIPQILCKGFLTVLFVAAMLLITVPIGQAQLAPTNMRSGPIRDRLFQPQIGTPSRQINALLSSGAANGLPQTIDGTGRSGRIAGNLSPNANRGLTVPYWSDSFSYQGLTYKYSMVGTDPKRGSATTTVPTVIIPMRFVFENGLVSDAATDLIDGQTSIQGIINSPVFQNYDFTSGGTEVGNTQYGDAFQRANFWNSVSKRSRDYHVLLGQPTIAPTYEVFVPNSLVTFIPLGNGNFFPLIEESLIEQATTDALKQAGISPQKLAIVDWGNVSGFLAGGFHLRELESTVRSFVQQRIQRL